MVASCCPPSGPSLLCKTGSRGMVYQFLNRSMVSGFKIIVWESTAEPNNSRMLRPDTSAWANLHSPFLGNMKEKKWREEREGREGGKEGRKERGKGRGKGEGREGQPTWFIPFLLVPMPHHSLPCSLFYSHTGLPSVIVHNAVFLLTSGIYICFSLLLWTPFLGSLLGWSIVISLVKSHILSQAFPDHRATGDFSTWSILNPLFHSVIATRPSTPEAYYFLRNYFFTVWLQNWNVSPIMAGTCPVLFNDKLWITSTEQALRDCGLNEWAEFSLPHHFWHCISYNQCWK